MVHLKFGDSLKIFLRTKLGQHLENLMLAFHADFYLHGVEGYRPGHGEFERILHLSQI